jgi:hypothetical protein
VVSVDLDTWGETRTETVDLPVSPTEQTRAAVAPDGTLLVATGGAVTEIDTATFERTDAWTTHGSILAMGFADEELFLLQPRSIEVIDPSRNRRIRAIPSPMVDDAAYIGLLDL